MKPTQRLIALGRIPNANRYGTRRLLAGDEFDAGVNDARLLLLAKLAKPVVKRERGKLSAPPKIVTDKVAAEPSLISHYVAANTMVASGTDELAAARAEYSLKFGKKPFHGWSVFELRAKIADNFVS